MEAMMGEHVRSWVVLAFLALAGSACRAPDPNPGLTGGELVFEDSFDGPDLGDDWSSEYDGWVIDEDGWLTVENARNGALWLNTELPDRVRVEFAAQSGSQEGDIKFEVFGDGETHESGYIAIFGGWSNSLNIIARLDEHGDDRLIGADGHTVAMGRTYQMALVRTDRRVRWYVDGELFITYDDPDPLVGEGHRHFAFNDWAAPLRFDDVRVYDLGDR